MTLACFTFEAELVADLRALARKIAGRLGVVHIPFVYNRGTMEEAERAANHFEARLSAVIWA